jgi:hypothetical protein
MEIIGPILVKIVMREKTSLAELLSPAMKNTVIEYHQNEETCHISIQGKMDFGFVEVNS